MRSVTFWRAVLLASVLSCTFNSCRQGTSGIQNGSVNQNTNGQPGEPTRQVVVDKGDLKLRYQALQNTGSGKANAVGSNPEALEKLITELNQRLILPFDLEVSFEDCKEPDAYYDPESHQILLCHQLIDEYYRLFAKKIKDQKKLDDAVRAAVAATFFHELGHGLVDAWKIPITGREEDAVDQLSTLVLIEGTEGGEQMALDGALSFKLYADLAKGEQKIFWDDHSLDEQRFFDTICLVYGHDEEKFSYLVDNQTLPEERASVCYQDYERVNRAWQQLLAPYLKPAQSPRKLRLRS
jgi:hypothetical protein